MKMETGPKINATIMTRRHLLALLVLLLACALPVVAAADGVGKAIFVIGKVTLTPKSGTPALLKKGQILHPGDRIQTSERGQVQIRMIDGAFMAIRPSSTLVIRDYELAENPEDHKSEFELLKGGFRAITGSIGKSNKDAYKIKTPVATLGIRGTDYVAMYCRDDCQQRRYKSDAIKIENGLYVGVLSGGVYIRTEVGVLDVDRHQYGFARNSRSKPSRLERAPDFLMFHTIPIEDEDTAAKDRDGNDGDGRDEAYAHHDGDREDEDRFAHGSDDYSGPGSEVVVIRDPAESLPDNVTSEYHAFSYVLDGAVNADESQAVSLKNGLELSAFSTSAAGSGGILLFEQGSSTALDLGYDAVTGISWGRWQDGNITVTDLESGDVSRQALGNNSLHWVSGPAENAPVSLPVTGTADYVLIGNTSPTDNHGNMGVLGSAALSADFTNQTVDASLQLGINNQVWSAQGADMAIGGNATFSGAMTVNVSDAAAGSSNGSGQMAGTFVGPTTASGAPAGIGAAYSLTASPGGLDTTVSGVTVYEAQQ